jgi:CxxC motif-containing protein
MSDRSARDRLTCVLCPVGCELEVAEDSAGNVRVTGNQCDQGVPFAEEEVLRPKRNLSTSVPIRGTASRMVSVRLSGPVPREMLFPVLAEIAKLRPEAPIRRGQVLIVDVLGTGVDVIATRTVA